MSPDLTKKLAEMQNVLRSLERVAVAFSAGVDSTLVLKVALDTLGPENVVAVTGQSDSLAGKEFEEAALLAAGVGAEHVILDTQEFTDPNYLANNADRCYFCKTELYGKLDAFIAERGLKAVVNGINVDDFGDFRPGLKAADEHSVVSPCAEARMTKQDIRDLSAHFGLPTYDKPASPCLSSRVEPGEEITPEKLKMIERAEAVMRGLGAVEFRVRHHGKLARIEVASDEINRFMQPETRANITAQLREIGYTWIAMDMTGFRSGSTNPVVAFGKLQPNIG
jgi:uncharacterized protein